MTDGSGPPIRCGIDTVEIARVDRLLLAAKEACLKLFPREAALGLIGPADFAVARDGYGAPRIVCSPSTS
jgi:phosphopantetheinyl transferase (holo-ACP synthase)